MSKIIEEPTIDVKLFIDRERSRVLFAESDNDFVDILVSFLTLPLGTIVRILGKQSQFGCLDEVYMSVEGLGTDYFQTAACRTMLLSPLNSAHDHCRRLEINIDDGGNPRAMYVCRDINCCFRGDLAFSSVPEAVCRCGKVMQYSGDRPENHTTASVAGGGSQSGVFVHGGFKYITTDDLRVEPASASLILSLLENFGIRDARNLEQRTVQLTSEKITCLLKRSLSSMEPLTGLCFDIPITYDDADLYELPENMYTEQENTNAGHKLDNVKIRAVLTKDNSSLLCAEVGDEFVDLLFGLLTIPLGSIIKAFGQWSSRGCVDNIYKSIDGSAKRCIKQESRTILLPPKLRPIFACSATKILQVEELARNTPCMIESCFRCFKNGGFAKIGRCRQQGAYGYINCYDTSKMTYLYECEPRSPKGKSHKENAYVKTGSRNLMITDDLHILPLSLKSTVKVFSKAEIQTNEIVEKEFSLTQSQVIEILNAALVTRNALTSVLLPTKKKEKAHHINSGLY